MKKKMDMLTKAKLIYSIELGVFAILFIVLSILRFVGLIGYNATRSLIFNWITVFGGSWIIADFFWAIFDKKRQKRIALIDKFIHLPAGIYLVAFDLYCLISKPSNDKIYQYGIASILMYLGLCYTFEAIYHFKYPVPGIIEAGKEEPVENPSKEESEENNNGESNN